MLTRLESKNARIDRPIQDIEEAGKIGEDRQSSTKVAEMWNVLENLKKEKKRKVKCPIIAFFFKKNIKKRATITRVPIDQSIPILHKHFRVVSWHI